MSTMVAKVRRLAKRIQTARLPHRCSLCGGWIEVGQKYVEVVALHDGRFSPWKYHHGKGTCLFERSRKGGVDARSD